MDSKSRDSDFHSAEHRFHELAGFYTHLAVFAIVNTGLFLINLFADGGGWWFYWVLLGWGIGLLLHAIVVFGINGPKGRTWKERKVRDLMAREQF